MRSVWSDYQTPRRLLETRQKPRFWPTSKCLEIRLNTTLNRTEETELVPFADEEIFLEWLQSTLKFVHLHSLTKDIFYCIILAVLNTGEMSARDNKIWWKLLANLSTDF